MTSRSVNVTNLGGKPENRKDEEDPFSDTLGGSSKSDNSMLSIEGLPAKQQNMKNPNNSLAPGGGGFGGMPNSK